VDGAGKKTAAAIHQEVTREVNQLLGRVFAQRRKEARTDLEAVESALRTALHHAGAAALNQLLARKCSDYIKRNQHRMRYAEFHAQGLCTSTGVVEAGCKVAIGTRLKRSGLHWTSRGANAIIALRCCKLSGRFEDFWERRAVRRAA